MSRATRPRAPVAIGLRFELASRAVERLGGVPAVGSRLVRLARGLGVRPAQLRRCLIGRPVSTRAAQRILTAARAA